MNDNEKGIKLVYLTLIHESFETEKTALVAVPSYYVFETAIALEGKRKVCEKLGLNKNKVRVRDYKVFDPGELNGEEPRPELGWRGHNPITQCTAAIDIMILNANIQ